MMEYFVVVFIYKMQQLEIGCVGNIIFFQKYYRQLKKKGSYIHIYRDVTSCYTRVKDVPVTPLKPVSVTYGYLSVFNNLKWEPVRSELHFTMGYGQKSFLVGYRVFIT